MNSTNWILVAVILVTGGCSTQEKFIPQDGPQMLDIYREALGETVGTASLEGDATTAAIPETSVEEPIVVGDTKTAIPSLYNDYTRTAENEVTNLFPRLHNPDIKIFVYPHLSTRTRVPVPGYTTVIPLFERVQYTFPGETLKR